jgi:hypothetical protein
MARNAMKREIAHLIGLSEKLKAEDRDARTV